MANEYVVNGSEEVIGNDIAAGNATVAGTLGVTGATTAAAITASGLITANAGVTVSATDPVTIDGNATIAGTLGVTGITTLGTADITTATISGNATVAGTLGITGATTAAAITASGLITANDGILVPDGNITIAEGGTGASTVPSALSNLGFLSNNPIVGTSIAIPGTILSTLTVGSNPRIIAIDSAGNQYVTNYGSNTVSKITPSGTVTLTWATVGSNPFNIAIDSAGNQYVTNYGSGTISIIAGNNGVLLPLLNQMQSYSEIQALNIATLDISNSGINNLSDYSNTSLNFSLSTNYNIQALSLIR